MRRLPLLAASLLTAALGCVGCAFGGPSATPTPTGDRYDLGPADSATPSASAWGLPAHVRAAGEAVEGEYAPAGSWDGGAACATELPPGTRAVAERIRSEYPGTIEVIPHGECRPHPVDPSLMAMSGTGRAIVVRVPSVGGAPNGALGDPIANDLVLRAAELGVQLVSWNGTKWSLAFSSRRDVPLAGDRYGDRVYLELTPAGASGEAPAPDETTPSDPADPTDPADPADPTDPTDPADPTDPEDPPPPPMPTGGCSDSCEFAFDGECDDGGPGAATPLCGLGTDCFDCGPR